MKVLIACCNGKGWIHKSVMFAVMKMLGDTRGNTVHFIAPTHTPLVNNQHRVVEDFLKGDDDFLLFVDDDNPPVLDGGKSPLDLVEWDLDVVGIPTPVWHSAIKGDRPYYTNALRDGKPIDSLPSFEPGGLHKVDSVGGGCMLIARRVLIKLVNRCKGKPWDAPFMRLWNDKGLVEMGNDFAFCERARKAGFEIWAHYDYICDHWNELPLLEVISSFGALQQKNEDLKQQHRESLLKAVGNN